MRTIYQQSLGAPLRQFFEQKLEKSVRCELRLTLILYSRTEG